MCLKLKDILHPFNIFGKDRKNFKITVPEEYGDYTYDIEWTGERLIVSYTYDVIIKIPPSERRRYPQPHKEIYTDGELSEETIIINQYNRMSAWQTLINASIYFDCTNVTSLIVNGETLI